MVTGVVDKSTRAENTYTMYTTEIHRTIVCSQGCSYIEPSCLYTRPIYTSKIRDGKNIFIPLAFGGYLANSIYSRHPYISIFVFQYSGYRLVWYIIMQHDFIQLFTLFIPYFQAVDTNPVQASVVRMNKVKFGAIGVYLFTIRREPNAIFDSVVKIQFLRSNG